MTRSRGAGAARSSAATVAPSRPGSAATATGSPGPGFAAPPAGMLGRARSRTPRPAAAEAKALARRLAPPPMTSVGNRAAVRPPTVGGSALAPGVAPGAPSTLSLPPMGSSGAAAVECGRRSCGATPATATWSEYRIVIGPSNTQISVAVNPVCLKCFLAWRKGWQSHGTCAVVLARCNDSTAFDDQFKASVEVSENELKVTWYPKDLGSLQEYGGEVMVIFRGLTQAEIEEVFGYAPADLGLTVTLLWKVDGGQFQGVALRDHPVLQGYGVVYRYFMKLSMLQREFMMQTADNIRQNQHEEMCHQFTSPSESESKEVMLKHNINK